MQIRLFNNTKLEDEHIMEDIKHFAKLINVSGLESVEINDDKVTFFGIDCILGEFDLNKDVEVSGCVRWFNESSGEGVIRLDSGNSVPFYSCNVKGADSLYPELVTNIQLNEGETVSAAYSCDSYTVKALGLTHIKKSSKNVA